MKESIAGVKKKISQRFLGTHGIHGVRSDPEAGKILVYAARGAAKVKGVLREMQALAAPYSVEIVDDEAPGIT
jgi:hypothetical protein